MKKAVIAALALAMLFSVSCAKREGSCLTGAFLSDQPSAITVDRFQQDYGKKPFFVLIFLDWGKFPDEGVIRDIYDRGSVLMITWEPWDAGTRAGIHPAQFLDGKYNEYIRTFALKLKAIGKPVFLRFAHEMNGNWYPWSGQKIGAMEYQKMARYVHDIFDRVGAENIRWVFSINVENVPPENSYALCYPGGRYVDYIGLDGYNWGTAQPWSRWRSFRDIFYSIYTEVIRRYQKPVIISEFSSTSAGGNKALWIEDALREMKEMPELKGFILFNIDKETDWCFRPDSENGRKLRDGLVGRSFKDVPEGNL